MGKRREYGEHRVSIAYDYFYPEYKVIFSVLHKFLDETF